MTILLAWGANIDRTASNGMTPLIVENASRRFRQDELLAAGADVWRIGLQGECAFLRAAGMVNVSAIELLLEHGADVNRTNEYVQNAITIATAMGHVAAVEKLLTLGVDVASDDPLTALWLAWRRRGKDVAAQIGALLQRVVV